MKINAGKGI